MSDELRQSLQAVAERWLNRGLNAQRRGQFEHEEGHTQNYLFGTHLGFENGSLRLKELVNDKSLADGNLLDALYQLADRLDDLANQMRKTEGAEDESEGMSEGAIFGFETTAAELRALIDRHERLSGGLL